MMSLDFSLFFLEPEKLSLFVLSFAGVSLGAVWLGFSVKLSYQYRVAACIHSLVDATLLLTGFPLVLLLLLCDTDGDPLAVVIFDLLHSSLRVLRHRVCDITEAPTLFCVWFLQRRNNKQQCGLKW